MKYISFLILLFTIPLFSMHPLDESPLSVDIETLRTQMETEIVPTLSYQAPLLLKEFARKGLRTNVGNPILRKKLTKARRGNAKALCGSKRLIKDRKDQYDADPSQERAIAVINLLKTRKKMAVSIAALEVAIALNEIREIEHEINEMEDRVDQLDNAK